MFDLSSYVLEQLRSDQQFVLHRGRSEKSLPHILVLSPASDANEHQTLKRLEHEYALRSELDPAWAAIPTALVRDKGRTVLVLEDPGGEPLERFLEATIELTRFLQIAIGLSSALRGTQTRAIVHRDIKPGHVLADITSGKVWLTGFGVATSSAREPHAPEPLRTIAGTLAYMAPEQTGRMNRTTDGRSDLYSLGVTLYHVLTGALPFPDSDPLELIHCHVARLPLPPEERRKDIPHPVSAIILKLLAKNPEDRYQTAAGLEADLRKCLEDWQSLGRIDPFVLGVHDAPSRLTISQKLYGRDNERTALFETFERVAGSGVPEVVVVSGYSGIGKSSLINELHKAIVLSRGIFVSGKFDQYKREIPYATLAQALQDLVQQIVNRDDSDMNYWRDAVRDAVGVNGEILLNIIPDLELLIGKPPRAPELSGQDADNRFLSVIRAFLGVFARKEHPLVIFLDDLQWLDAATTKLLEPLIDYPEPRHLLLVSAYRDNEIGPYHPARLMLDAIRKSGIIVRDIRLGPLSPDDVKQLITDSFHQRRADSELLAQLVYEKTAGNPFFINQFLDELAAEHLFEFDPSEASWKWNLELIRVHKLTDSLIELLIGKLNRLSDNSLEILKKLACLGNSVDAATFALIHDGADQEIQSATREAILSGFVVHSGGRYNFIHDRVQEAAYSLIPEDMRAEVHVRLGRLLLSRMRIDELAEKIFDVVNQVNRGVALISDANEKQRVAELNVDAGKKAKSSTAYTAACNYLSTAMTLCGHEHWTTQYDFTFKLWLERAECEFLNKNWLEAETLISQLLDKARSKTDVAAAYCLRINIQFMKSEYAQAVASALECLRMLGVEMPLHPIAEHVRVEYEKVLESLGERSIETLIDLPLMNDPEMQGAMRVLSVLQGPAFTTDTNLYYLCACEMARISLKHGIIDSSALGLALFGRVLGPLLGRYRDGYLLGKLAVDLSEKHGFIAYKPKVYFVTALAAVWTESMTAVIDLLRKACGAGIETGDLICQSYCYTHMVPFLLVRGDHLDEVAREAERSRDSLLKSKFVAGAETVLSQQQFVRCMQGQTFNFASFSDACFDEAAFEAHIVGESGWATMTCWHWILRLRAAFLSGRYEAALAAAEKAKAILWATAGCIQLLDYHYYAALSITALFGTTGANMRSGWREALDVHVSQLRHWAERCSTIFKDKYTLVLAEVARIERRDLDAMRLYEEAVECARENTFIQNEAVANEVAAAFYLDRGFKTIGHTYIRNAHSNYVLWGARAKVKNLEKIHPILREQASSAVAALDTSIERLDLTSVVRALQAVSREIDLAKLIYTLMANAVEHAGAQRGLLFLCHGPELRIEAQATTHNTKVEVSLAKSFAAPPKFAADVVDYAIRTLESVVVDDGAVPNRFSDDAHMLAQHPRSVLCLPLVRQRASIGVLYLENNLAPKVFTKDRLAVLELIATQAAISLANSQLYADLQQENEERKKAEVELHQSTEALSNLQEEMRQASRVAMMGELTASLAHELNQPLGGIRINAQTVRRFLTAKKPNLKEVRAAVEEIISDNSRAVDIIRNVRSLFQRDDKQMTPIDVKEILLDVRRILEADALRRDVTLRCTLPSLLPTVIGNRTQLLQAVVNLVLNAFDAVCEDGVELREVEISAREQESGRVQVAVKDSGKGIDPANMPRLFDAFFTTKPNGMGMGLAIVRSIVENHGGRLSAMPSITGGASLEFDLPIKAA
jgi:predicted ATPase/signal transduction histidine kinase